MLPLFASHCDYQDSLLVKDQQTNAIFLIWWSTAKTYTIQQGKSICAKALPYFN